MRQRFYGLAVLIVLLLLARSAVFVVDETQTAIVTQFGSPVRVVEEAGLNWKLPQPVQAVRFFDSRLLVFDPKPTEFLTNDKKNIVADAYVAWRIAEPQMFLETVTDREGAEVRMADIVASEMGCPSCSKRFTARSIASAKTRAWYLCHQYFE